MDTSSMPSMPPPPPPLTSFSGNDRLLAILCHVSIFLGVGFILPLIVYLVKKNESELVAAHAKEVLNFHISLVIYTLCTIPLMFVLIGFPLFFLIGISAFICAILAAIRASEGGFYFYPLTLRLIT